MPTLFEDKVIKVKAGMVCDCCGVEDPNRFNDFEVLHTFGYGTQLDTSSVSAAICDACLARIILERVPGAIFKDNRGKRMSKAQTAQLVEEYTGKPVSVLRQTQSVGRSAGRARKGSGSKKDRSRASSEA